MARILITGSADGLGQLSARSLIRDGHEVVLHARNKERARQAMAETPGAAAVFVADLSSLKEAKDLAFKANASGRFDAVIHNAGVYQVPRASLGAEGYPLLLTVNSLAPYLLTCLLQKPERLIYFSSGMHLQGDGSLENLSNLAEGGNGHISYPDTKLHAVILAMAVASRWRTVLANAVNPGWVPTKMGGAGAPDSLEKGVETQVWLAVSMDTEATVSGRYFHHKKQDRYLPAAGHTAVQEKFLSLCERLTGVPFPAA